MKYEFKMKELNERKEKLILELEYLNRDITVAQMRCNFERGSRSDYTRVRQQIQKVDRNLSYRILDIMNSEYYKYILKED